MQRIAMWLCLFAWVMPMSLNAQVVEKPNIIYIMVDDLGYGDLGCYGQKVIQTPHIDKMAAEGMKFLQCYAGSTVCAPSRSVLMTGQHTGHTFIRGNAKVNLRAEDVTVAEVLKKAGYNTALIGKWGIGHEGSNGMPTRQGFDYFFGYLDQHHAHNFYPTFLIKNESRFPLRNVVPNEGQYGQGVATKKVDYTHDLLAEDTLKWLDKNHKNPFFLYLALTIPHANNEAGKKGMEVPDYGIYKDKDWPEPQKGHAAMISRMDKDIGRIMAKLKELGVDKDTIVFFTSDNGPHREGGNNPDFFNSNGQFRGIKRALYEGGIRVPMIVRWPEKIRAGAVSDHRWAFWDFLPTAADLAGVLDKAPKNIDGLSIKNALFEKPCEEHDFFFWAFFEQGSRRAVLMGDYKLIEEAGRGGPLELYNLADDIGETTNIVKKHPDIVKKMYQVMEAQISPNPHWSYRDYKPKKNNSKPKK